MSAAHENVSAIAATRSQSKNILVTPRNVASPLVKWIADTLITPTAPNSANYAPKASARPVDRDAAAEFVLQRQSVTRFVRDARQSAVGKQKKKADKRGRKNISSFTTADKILLSTDAIRQSAITNLGASKFTPRFIRPFTVIKVLGDAYTLEIPKSLRLHPTFYVGRLKQYYPDGAPRTSNVPRDEPAGPSTRHFPAPTHAGEAQSVRPRKRVATEKRIRSSSSRFECRNAVAVPSARAARSSAASASS